MKRVLLYLPTVFLFINAYSQTETFDIASFVSPKGWARIDSNNTVRLEHEQTKNGLTSFCQIYIYPSRLSNNTAAKNFEAEWTNRVVPMSRNKTKPKTTTEKTPDGWTVVSGFTNISTQGITFTCMLVTMTGFGKTMPVLINLAGQNYLADVENFFNVLELNSTASGVPPSIPQQTIPVYAGTGGLNDYNFIAPARWLTQRNKDFILLSQLQSPERGCIISILPPQTSSGNIEVDARNVFTQMYPGWTYQMTGENREDISKGYTSQGLEFCRIEARMQKDRGNHYYFDYESGDALVIKLSNKQIVVIASRHNRGEMVCFCKHQYEYWGGFFNSFKVKNITVSDNSADISKRIVGKWQSIGGSALVSYIFAPNNHYQFIGAFSTSSRIDRYTIQYRTSSFKGDGTYILKGNQLIITKDGTDPENLSFRMEQVNHGSIGWKDKLYLLAKSTLDGKDYEVGYEKQE